MTESEWLASEEPGAMLYWLTTGSSRIAASGRRPAGYKHGRAPEISERKLRLVACAIWRSRWRHIMEGAGQAIIAIEDETWNGEENGWQVAEAMPHFVSSLRGAMVGIHNSKAKHGEDGLTFAEQAAILRDIINPWRLFTLNPSHITEDARRIAQHAYNERDFSGLSVLADALEEAGAADMGLLQHLRSKGQHVRGCAAIDAILGRS